MSFNKIYIKIQGRIMGFGEKDKPGSIYIHFFQKFFKGYILTRPFGHLEFLSLFPEFHKLNKEDGKPDLFNTISH